MWMLIDLGGKRTKRTKPPPLSDLEFTNPKMLKLPPKTTGGRREKATISY